MSSENCPIRVRKTVAPHFSALQSDSIHLGLVNGPCSAVNFINILRAFFVRKSFFYLRFGFVIFFIQKMRA